MYPEIQLWIAILFIVAGLAVLAWSADMFVAGAASLARVLGISPLIVGMVIIGFGTSAPELCVSALSASGGHSDLSLGNAYGSAIFNIAFILGIAALIRPLPVKPGVSLVAAPALVAISLFSCLLVGAGDGFSRTDGILELAAFFILLPLYCIFDQRISSKAPKKEEAPPAKGEGWHSAVKLAVGLALLAGSSHILVWGCVQTARSAGVSDLMIGLTIVAVGTSLPELASAIVSARKGEHEFVLGNIIGSNFFNILAVVGLAGTIQPFERISPYVLTRDMPVMVLVSVLITLFGLNWRNVRENGLVTRWKGLVWLLIMVAYTAVMACQEMKIF